MDRDTLLNLIPAYTLGALDPDDRAAVETWLASDPEAQALLVEYQAVADQLNVMIPLHQAPAHLEADLRQRLTGERPPAVVVRSTRVPAPRPAISRRRNLRWLRLALPLAALLILVIAGTIYVWQQPDESLTDAELYKQIIAQEDSQKLELIPVENQGDASAALAVSPNGTQAVICFWSLPELASDQTYQLWLLDDEGTLRSGGVFQSEAPEDTYVRVPLDASISFYQAFGVSIEPSGGSPLEDQPSGPRVFRVEL